MKRQWAHIGTSGWHYPHWKGPFYPQDLPDRGFLEYYGRHFLSTEINNSFYQMPSDKTLKEWRDSVPRGFVFSIKASRYITHMKKLKDAREPVSHFLKKAEILGERLGPVLFQLPPRWRCNPGRLETFLKLLPKGRRYAFEFRDPTWWSDEVYGLLAGHGSAFCIFDLNRELSPKEVTAGFVYIRLHGPDGPYRGKYTDRALKGWAGDLAAWRRKEKEVYCYFDNDEAGYAAQDALRLQGLVAKSHS